jgi:succinyl-diaminopimelate desuccinylase
MTTSEPTDPLAHVREDRLVAHCARLVQIRSVNPPGGELAIAEYVADILAAGGIATELISHGTDRASVLARIRGRGEAPNLLYSAHLDTVPVGADAAAWLHNPFGGEVADGKVWGRGSADMKGGLAAMIAAALALVEADAPLRGDLLLAFTAGEEVDSLGAYAVAERTDLGPVGAIVVSEPSSNALFVAEKGALWIELITYGQTAHGSMPELGRNAVMMMVALLGELDRLPVSCTKHPLLGSFTRSINTISGGVKTNVVPDRCTATVDMRTVPGQDHAALLRQIEALIADLGARQPGFRASIKVLNDNIPLTTPPDHPAVGRMAGVIEAVTGRRPAPGGVRYYSDAVAYVPAFDAPMLICGPGQAGLAHQPDEYVEIDRLVESARILTLAAMHLP